MQVGYNCTKRYSTAEDVAEVKAVRGKVMDEHLIVVGTMLVKELMLNKVSKVEAESVEGVIEEP